MKNVVRVAVLMSSFTLAACSDPPAEPVQAAPDAASPPTQITAENQGVLTDAQRDGLNAANQASALINQAAEERRRQLEAAERR